MFSSASLEVNRDRLAPADWMKTKTDGHTPLHFDEDARWWHCRCELADGLTKGILLHEFDAPSQIACVVCCWQGWVTALPLGKRVHGRVLDRGCFLLPGATSGLGDHNYQASGHQILWLHCGSPDYPCDVHEVVV